MAAAAADPYELRRGAELLLSHCDAVGRFERGGPSALERLERVLGGDLTRRLVESLSGDHRMRSRRAPV